MNKIPGLTVKAIVNRFDGTRIEGAQLTEILLEYAEKNRDHFNFIYTGDTFEPAGDGDRIENAPSGFSQPGEASGSSKFSKDQLMKLSKNHLLELADGMKLVIEGESSKDAITDLILAEQNKGG